MSMQKVSVLVPPARPVPPGAAWFAGAVPWLFGGQAGIRTGLAAWFETIHARLAVERAARAEARSRAEVLAMAHRYESNQPEFAKDLYAAALNDRQI